MSDLSSHPERYDFLQAIRLLERQGRARGRAREPVGEDADSRDEVARFTAQTGLAHPAGEITGLTQRSSAPTDIEVSFLGLTGPSGVLPDHYTSLLLSRLRANDRAMLDFLNLFHHRLISLFHRAAEKYNVPLSWERHQSVAHQDDFSQAVLSLAGMGTDHLQRRSGADRAVNDFAGFFSRQVRPVAGLLAVLKSYFQLPIRIEQFRGQWLRLDEDQRTRLPGQFNRLGQDAVLGERVRDAQSSFAVLVGPVDYAKFRQLMPDRTTLRELCELTRQFAGPEFDFDVQLELLPEEVPHLTLGGSDDDASRLGWNTWLFSRPIRRQVTDATFSLEILQTS